MGEGQTFALFWPQCGMSRNEKAKDLVHSFAFFRLFDENKPHLLFLRKFVSQACYLRVMGCGCSKHHATQSPESRFDRKYVATEPMWVVKVSDFMEMSGAPLHHEELKAKGLLHQWADGFFYYFRVSRMAGDTSSR